MPLAFAAIGLGVLYLISGIKGKSIADVFSGNVGSPLDPSGGSSTTVAYFGDGEGGTAAPPDTGGSDVGVTGTTQIFDGHPVADWIVPILKWARAHGWTGRVNSGYRSRAEQEVLYARYKNSGFNNAYIAAKPGTSNHEGKTWPRGAVDVTQEQQLIQVLKHYPGKRKLVWFGPGDHVHFSSNGH